jgi:hypothetical protein
MAMEGPYLAYMLRLWKAEAGESAAWRALLENCHTGERHAFGSLEALSGFLATITGNQVAPGTTADSVDGEHGS